MNMDKTVNLLSYLPGHAGHFISIILSIDDITFLPSKYPPKDQLLKNLSYKNINWVHGSWEEFHKSYSVEPWEGIPEFFQSDKKIYTAIFHPSKLERLLEISKDNLPKLNVNWIQIELSPELEFINDDFKKRNGNWPKRSFHDEKNYALIKQKFNPYIINLDNVFYGLESFIFEYKKLCDYINVPYHLDIVIPYYNDWLPTRKLHRYDLKNGAPTWT
jgi:hypothetical protein